MEKGSRSKQFRAADNIVPLVNEEMKDKVHVTKLYNTLYISR